MNKKIERIISISDESPHDISNGYILRVNKMLVAAAHRVDIDVHCISPVTQKINDKAHDWANAVNVTLHGVSLEREMLWDKNLRKVYKNECFEILSRIATNKSLVIMHGVNSIIDFSNLKIEGHLVADLIDETSPHMIRSLVGNLIKGRLVKFIRVVKYLSIYLFKVRQLFDKYENVIVVAHDDARRMRRFVRGKEISVLPNGVEIPNKPKFNFEKKNPNVLFHGVFGYYPNDEAALFLINNMAPELIKECPHLKVLIVGRNPSKHILEAGSRQSNVKICGEVNDLSDYLLNASVGVYPIFTRTGIQNKILEAWAHGLPVVTTPGILEVFNKFSKQASHCALSATTSKEFASRCSVLNNNRDVRDFLSDNAMDFIKKHFDWDKTIENLIQLVSRRT